jgi:hypothetical protein
MYNFSVLETLKGDTDASILEGVKIVQNKTEICLFSHYPRVT